MAEALSGASSGAATELMAEVDELLQKSQREVKQCLECWLERHHAASKTEANEAEQVDANALAKLLRGHTRPRDALQEAQRGGEATPPPKDQEDASPAPVAVATIRIEPDPPGIIPCQLFSVVPPANGSMEPEKKGRDSRAPVSFCDGVNGDDFQKDDGAQRSSLAKKRQSKRAQQNAKMMASKTGIVRVAEETRCLVKLVRNRYYEAVSSLLITSNCFVIGWTTQWLADRAADRAATGEEQIAVAPRSFLYVQSTYCMMFFCELVLRWASEGFFEFFQGEDQGWNIFDIMIVGLDLVDVSIELALLMTQSDGEPVFGNLSVLRVLRVVRVVRVVRVIRVMRFFRELRMMVLSTLGCMKSLLWIMLTFGLLFYIFSVSFTSACVSYLRTTEMWKSEDNQPLIEYFGSVDRSIVSLYQAMSGGNDWAVYFEALQDMEGTMWKYVFLLYITFAVFAVINVVTGVFLDTALQCGKADKEVMVHEELESRKEYLSNLKELFEALDHDCNGYLTRKEFNDCLHEERVAAFFSALKLDVREAQRIFELLDVDGSGEVTIQEFVDGCYTLSGEATGFDAKMTQAEVRYLNAYVVNLAEMVQELRDAMMPAHFQVVKSIRKSVRPGTTDG